MLKLESIKFLDLPKWKYAIFWSGPIAIRGIRENDDFDIIVKNDIYEQLCRKYNEKIKYEPVERIHIWNVEIGNKRMNDPGKIDEMIDTADIINWYPFVKLKYFKKWKQKMWRDKDKKDLQLLEEYEKNKKSTPKCRSKK